MRVKLDRIHRKPVQDDCPFPRVCLQIVSRRTIAKRRFYSSETRGMAHGNHEVSGRTLLVHVVEVYKNRPLLFFIVYVSNISNIMYIYNRISENLKDNKKKCLLDPV